MMKKLIFHMVPLLMVLSGCVQQLEPIEPIINEDPTEMSEMVIPPDFDFATTSLRTFHIQVQSPLDEPIPGVPIYLYSGITDEGGSRILASQTNDAGILQVELPLALTYDSLYAYIPFPGIPNTYAFRVRKGRTDLTFGGSSPESNPGIRIFNRTKEDGRQWIPAKTDNFSRRFVYMGGYDTRGYPEYLEPQRDNVDGGLLGMINNSLPEGASVPQANPAYIAEGTSADIRLQANADVYLTFVHEGAGWRNAVGYYTYDLSSPPATSDDIDSLYIIFPNTSFLGGGGALHAGDKVYLGNFPANTGIGWFLVPNGWAGSVTGVRDIAETKFSNRAFNTYTNPEDQSHIALLNDADRELLLMGIEDQTRPGGDQDFNDAVFYVTASPFSAILTEDLPEVKNAPDDRDGDGVADHIDLFPNNPDKAFEVCFPTKNTFGTVAYEDLWPFQGDYDLNDMVVDYNYRIATNADNKAVKIRARFRVRALGAGMDSGFGIELRLPPSAIESVSGYEFYDNEIILSANGTEAGQSRAVIIAFDNGHALMNEREGVFVNTDKSLPEVADRMLDMNIQFSTPQDVSDLGLAPFNPFIFTERGRGYEIHLPAHTPTDLADNSLFGTGHDRTTPSESRYYTDVQNLPWAIHIPDPFSYPIEKRAIIGAHLRFANWAQNGGQTYTDWYRNNAGYRNETNIY